MIWHLGCIILSDEMPMYLSKAIDVLQCVPKVPVSLRRYLEQLSRTSLAFADQGFETRRA